MIGTDIGPYRVLDKLGEGGMGEVYKARDARLQRNVAIKILPALFASDPERLARFEREAQLLASLNHPNIAQIYGVEEAQGTTALIMELVDGPTLAQVIAAQGRVTTLRASHASTLDVDRLAIARQLIDALEGAHEQGIVHRDLKPQNIILRNDGSVKVLDFGLAKALEPVSALERSDHSPTITNAATRVGTLLGTAGYMAPEQVKGRPADRRADVWAFGAVLYELYTGAMAFGGETMTETLARVIEREPDWSRLPADTPASVVRLLHRTLVKDPKRRLQSIGDARLELDEPIDAPVTPIPAATHAGARWAVAAIALASCIGLGILIGRATRTAAPAINDPAIRASIALPPGTFLDGAGPPILALSPDGRTLAFVARTQAGLPQLYVRGLTADSPALVPGSETAEGPFFSPDGRWIGFAVGVSGFGNQPQELRKYSLDTGLTQTICTITDFFGGTWRDDGTIVYVDHQPSGLWTVSSGGGQPRQAAGALNIDGKDVESQMAWPAAIANSHWVIVVTPAGHSRFGELTAVDVDSRRAVPLHLEGSAPQLLANGDLAYGNANSALTVVKFDAANMRTTGTPAAAVPDLALARGNVPVFAVARNGTLAYVQGYLRFSRHEPMQLVRVSKAGAATTLAFEPDLLGRALAMSADGNRVAVGAWDSARWIYDLRRGTRQRIEPGALADVYSVAWHSDGRHLAAAGPLRDSGTWGVVTDALDGSSAGGIVREQPTLEIFTAGWLPDGRTQLTWTVEADKSTISLRAPGQAPRTVVKEAMNITSVAMSPDGRWVAYDATSSVPFHIYVVPIAGGVQTQVSARQGITPRWSADGRQLFFRSGPGMYAVDVKIHGDDIDFANERKLFDADMARDYAVAPSGDFYTTAPAADVAYQRHIELRTRWFDELGRLK
jgi:hypothetical protein